MWPFAMHWQSLRFGVEIEFIRGRPTETELLPGWVMALDELQTDETGAESGSELKPPPIGWEDREQIRTMLDRLQAQGAEANWSCGLHVHVGLDPWGEAVVLPLLDAALSCQEALRELLQTSAHRDLYCPPVTREMRKRFAAERTRSAVHRSGRPQSHRCGINAAAWFDFGTVEIRYANGSLDYEEVVRTIELCLRFVAAVGEGRKLPGDPLQLAIALGVPDGGYPPPAPAPRWHLERMWLEESMIPLLAPIAACLVPQGEIHHIVPRPEGFLVAIEATKDGSLSNYIFRLTAHRWEAVRTV